MHCALQEISTDSSKVSKGQKDSLSRKYQEQSICTTSLKDCEESSLSRRNSDSRCTILAFLTLEPDGNWRIVALPVRCLNHISLAPHVNMDGLQLVFPPALNRLKIDQHKGQRGLLPEYGYSVKSLKGRSITGSNVHRRCQNKIASRASKLNELSGNSCSQSSLICSNSSGSFPDSSEVNSSDMFMSNSKGEKPLKKNSRKKARKRGRQTKKQSCDSGSTEPEVLPEEYVHVGSTSESHCSNDVDNEVGLMSYTTGLETSFSDDRLIKNDSERREMDDTVNLTEAPKTCYSYIDEAEMSEVTSHTVQKSSGESAICNSKNQIQNRGPEFADIDGEMEDKQQIQICCYNNMFSKESSQIQDSLVLGSVSVGGSNSDESINAGDVVKQSDKASCRIGLSVPPGFNSGDGCILGNNLLNGVGNTCDQNEQTRHGAQNCSSNDKKVKQKRKAPRTLGVNKFGGVGNLHGRTGKENSHSVWQKVQKNDRDECSDDLKKANSTFSQSDSTMKRAPPINRSCNFTGANILSKSEEKKHLKNNVGRKAKGKMDRASKKEHCSYSRKGSHFNRAILNDNAKISIQQNGMLHISSQENNQEGLTGTSGSHYHINSPRVGFQSSQVEQMASESVHSAQMHMEESKPPKSVGHTISTMTNQNKENQDSTMPCDRINQLCMSEEQSPLYSHLLGDVVGQIEKEVSSTDYNEQNNSAGSTLWKWIPIGKKDTGLAFSESTSSSLEYSDRPPSKDIILESNVAPKGVSICQNHCSSSNASRTCVGQTYSNFSCLDEDENQKLGNQVANALTEHSDEHVAANHLICECENQDVLESYSYKISQAVNDVCRAQIACEAVHIATGGPIAEFERLLHCCSPVICQSPNVLRADGIPLCRHETPDLSLECLWQWYEKHGSYGLEIRTQDYKNPKELGAGCFPFRAYFVPSLSAVQLFKNHKSQCVKSSNKFPHCSKASEVCETSNTLESSSAASRHPIFSVIIPESHSQDASIPTPRNQIHCSEAPSASTKDNASGRSINSTCSGDLELLFEYFESEQPQQRRPLFEKIQELVRGDLPAQSKVYGDPSKLDSINLQDLHPRSWYSVAWYPIYRIPDGNFRASFLTYHSFGHLVNRSMKTDSPTVDSGIVAPVVGLQSYNAQGECWFQLRHSTLTAELLGLNPSMLLKERLRTLEETASLMARAAVNKGNLICTNRHPDYEFFLSRRRY